MIIIFFFFRDPFAKRFDNPCVREDKMNSSFCFPSCLLSFFEGRFILTTEGINNERLKCHAHH